jgi:ribonuclease G
VQTVSAADKKLVINANASEVRIALLQDGELSELIIERQRDKSILGNIYLGRVTRVLPGMNAAFVNIGLDRTAFLYGGDVFDSEELQEHRAAKESVDPEHVKESSANKKPIEKMLRDGQDVVIQVAKEPLGTKGARVTMYLSLPGRYLVLMPDFNHIGLSRRLDDQEEKDRLTNIVQQIKPDTHGVIIRTAANGENSGNLQRDLKYLLKVWRSVDAKRKRSSAPSLLYQDIDVISRSTRDLYSDDVSEIVIDNQGAFENLTRFLNATAATAAAKIRLYEEKTPIFDVYGIEVDIGRALSNRVDLPSGGYLVIDQTEALTSFDVNTGRFVGQLSAQETILTTNLESIRSIVSQLRIRNIGGIIVIDFIDMEQIEDRERVYDALQLELKKDKARTNVLKISELGLVQMTRKRTSESLEQLVMDSCPYCAGRGKIRTTQSEAFDLIREIKRSAVQTGKRKITVNVRADIYQWLQAMETAQLTLLQKVYKVKVDFKISNLTLSGLRESPFEVISD